MGQRLAVFSLVDWSFATVRNWAASAGHEIALVVTQPPSKSAPGLRDATAAGSDAVVMIVPTVAACQAALADLRVDLGVVFSFPRVPDGVASLPRCGTVNLHPSLLPAYRGPNGYRSLYAGEPQIGATLHHLTSEFDAGPILAQASEPTPENVDSASALEALQRVATSVLESGVPRALAGERGVEQDASGMSDAPRFSPDEAVLDLGTTRHLFQCRLSALILAGLQPMVTFDGEHHPVRLARSLPGLRGDAAGVLSRSPRRAIVAVSDGVLEIELGKLPF